MPLDTAPTAPWLPKSDDVLARQLQMIVCLMNGNRKAARFWARCAASYRQRDASREPRDRDDWIDRCGW